MRMVKFQNAIPLAGIDIDKLSYYAIQDNNTKNVKLILDGSVIILGFPTSKDAVIAINYFDINTNIVTVTTPNAKKVLDHPNKSFIESFKFTPQVITEALSKTKFNKEKAAKLLNCSYGTFCKIYNDFIMSGDIPAIRSTQETYENSFIKKKDSYVNP